MPRLPGVLDKIYVSTPTRSTYSYIFSLISLVFNFQYPVNGTMYLFSSLPEA